MRLIAPTFKIIGAGEIAAGGPIEAYQNASETMSVPASRSSIAKKTRTPGADFASVVSTERMPVCACGSRSTSASRGTASTSRGGADGAGRVPLQPGARERDGTEHAHQPGHPGGGQQASRLGDCPAAVL